MAMDVFEPMYGMLNSVIKLLGFGWVDSSAQPYIAKAFFFIIILASIYTLLNTSVFKNSENKKISMIISVCISAISIIFMPDEIASATGNQYGFIVSAILFLGLPTLALGTLFYKIHESSSIGPKTKIGLKCALLGVISVLFGRFSYNYAQFSSAEGFMEIFSMVTGFLFLATLVYLGRFVFSIVSFSSEGLGRALSNNISAGIQNLENASEKKVREANDIRQINENEIKLIEGELKDVHSIRTAFDNAKIHILKFVNAKGNLQTQRLIYSKIQSDLGVINDAFRDLVSKYNSEQKLVELETKLRGETDDNTKTQLEKEFKSLKDEKTTIDTLYDQITQAVQFISNDLSNPANANWRELQAFFAQIYNNLKSFEALIKSRGKLDQEEEKNES